MIRGASYDRATVMAINKTRESTPFTRDLESWKNEKFFLNADGGWLSDWALFSQNFGYSDEPEPPL